MEDPLIDKKHGEKHHQEISSAHLTNVGSSRGLTRSHDLPHEYNKAAALVDLAEDEIGLPQDILEKENFDWELHWYSIDMRLNIVWSLNLIALILLGFFEMPLWCAGSSSEPCGNREEYYLGELPYLTRVESLYWEITTWAIFLVHTFFPIVYLGSSGFWKNRVNLLKVVLLALLAVDISVYGVYAISSGSIIDISFRFAPYIRVFLLIVDIRTLRECVRTLVAIARVLDVVALFLAFLLFFSCLAFVLFEDTEQGSVYFSSYGITVYRMFVLFTTSNNPDVWLPAYKNSRASCLFFILYILFGVYFITNLILAVVYDSFKDQLIRVIRERRSKRKTILRLAFVSLDHVKRGYLDKKQCILLFRALNKYRTLPKIEEKNFNDTFKALDDSGDLKITVDEFEDLCENISLKFPKAPEPSCLERFPSFYNSIYSSSFKKFIRGKKFEYLVLGMLLLNLVAVVIETTLDLQNSTEQGFWQDVEFYFGWLYVVEMLLKIYAYGFSNYWREGLNKFDFCITCIIVIGETLTFALPNSLPIISNVEWIRYLIIARLLRLIRLLLHVPRFRVIISTFLKLIPHLTPFLATNFCMMCIYCSLGVQLFGGLVNSYNETLESTDLYQNDYLLHNFNDYPTGMVTLFQLLVMGNWQVWLESFVTLTGTWWTAIYFISFYALGILFLLNLVVAFVLEAFFAEMNANGTFDTQGTSGTDDGNSVSKARSENVDTVLNHILGDELNRCETDDEAIVHE